MGNIFEPGISRDVYLEHMKNTMEWIEDRMRGAAEEARNHPDRIGYEVVIKVEGRWLQQLVAECTAKHMMLTDCQRRLGEIGSCMAMSQRIVIPPEAIKP